MTVRITGAVVTNQAGVEVAWIDAIKVGGGTAGRMDPQGQIVWVTDPVTEHFHVRLLSQAGQMIPDELETVDTYEDAIVLAEAYAAKIDKNAGLIAEFRESLNG